MINALKEIEHLRRRSSFFARHCVGISLEIRYLKINLLLFDFWYQHMVHFISNTNTLNWEYQANKEAYTPFLGTVFTILSSQSNRFLLMVIFHYNDKHIKCVPGIGRAFNCPKITDLWNQKVDKNRQKNRATLDAAKLASSSLVEKQFCFKYFNRLGKRKRRRRKCVSSWMDGGPFIVSTIFSAKGDN